jgi:hypothetical protein
MNRFGTKEVEESVFVKEAPCFRHTLHRWLALTPPLRLAIFLQVFSGLAQRACWIIEPQVRRGCPQPLIGRWQELQLGLDCPQYFDPRASYQKFSRHFFTQAEDPSQEDQILG